MHGGQASDTRQRLIAVTLDEASIGRSSPEIEHERAAAIHDLVEENNFAVPAHEGGPYALALSMAENRLVFAISEPATGKLVTHLLSLTPLRKTVRDYFLICESYDEAVRAGSPGRVEAIDMGRRGLHDEGARLLVERLAGKVDIDFATARRLFTLICALHWKG